MNVLLFQLPVPNNPSTNIPLAAGYLMAYAQAQTRDGCPANISILPRQIADYAGDALLVQAIVAHAPDMLGMSLYTWNSERSLDIARRVKERLPHLVVVGGGPEVQPDNNWLLQHPGLDIAVIGEGEQTFVALLHWLHTARDPAHLAHIAGLAYRNGSQVMITSPRVALDDLAIVPSPYLTGCLDVSPGGMALVEVSRWCPYACSFCLYGRNMGTKLGRRYFDLERVLAEVAWAKQRGAAAIHFVEANLNLIPHFARLMAALADLNADRALALYAELRGEHLSEEVVIALERAGLRVAEVGLQTANPTALAAVRRTTSLPRWAAGTRRLLDHKIEVLLDVILGLPLDDTAGIQTTLRFIEQERLGDYDIFMLQVLPGTAIRQQARQYGLVYQERPPYYVLQTSSLSFAELQQERHRLKSNAGLNPDDTDGVPLPRCTALERRAETGCTGLCNAAHFAEEPVQHIDLGTEPYPSVQHLASHVDLIVGKGDIQAATAWLAAAISANPTTLFDIYLICQEAPCPDTLHAWRTALPHQPGYLDYLAIYQPPEAAQSRLSPRLWIVLPWSVVAEPACYTPWARVIWHYEHAADEVPPLGAWRAAGGAGIWVTGSTPAQADTWSAETGLLFWV